MRARSIWRGPLLQLVGPANHLVEITETELRHQLAHFLGKEHEERDHIFGRAIEAPTQFGVLGRDADRASVEMAFAHHHAARGDQSGRGDAEFVGAQQRADYHLAARADAAIDLHGNAAAQPVQHQGLMRLGETDFPRLAGMMDRAERRRAGAALMARDRDMIRIGLAHAGRDRADAELRDQLHADPRLAVRVLQVVDELRQVLDRIDVVMRRRRDQPDAGHRIARARDPIVDFVAGKLAALAGLRALRHLDLQIGRVDEIFDVDAEAAACHLLDRRAHRIAVGQRLVALRVLAALAGIRAAADPVHGDGEGGMRLPRDRAERHRAGREALDDLARRLDLGK